MRGVALSVVLLVAALAAPLAEARVSVAETCPGEQSVGVPGLTYAAYAEGRVQVRTSAQGELVRTFGRTNQNGVRTVFGVVSEVVDRSCRPVGYAVQLPMRPNGASGFVPLDSVRLQAVRSRVEVDLSERRLTLFRGDEPVLTATAGIGARGTPTPTGAYYVNQMLRPEDPAGSFGPGAIGISAYSPALVDWAQGGPVAIHGTNDPSSVGRSVSHGCIRVQNPVLRRLWRVVQPGSPVVIHA